MAAVTETAEDSRSDDRWRHTVAAVLLWLYGWRHDVLVIIGAVLILWPLATIDWRLAAAPVGVAMLAAGAQGSSRRQDGR